MKKTKRNNAKGFVGKNPTDGVRPNSLTSRILVCLPAYNEEEYIGEIIHKTKQYAKEIIVIDDGSTDQTSTVAKCAGAVVIRHQENNGYGKCIQAILQIAKTIDFTALVILDADGQHDPREIPRLYQPILEGYDLVIGSRKKQSHKIPRYRYLGQMVLAFFSRLLSSTNISDSECGFRALSKKAVGTIQLHSPGFAIETEMIVEAVDKHLKITEVPISVIYTKDGSTINPVVHGVGNLVSIIRMIYKRRRFLFASMLGLAITLIGLIVGALILIIPTASEGLASNITPIAVLLLAIGVSIAFTGLILHILAKRRNMAK